MSDEYTESYFELDDIKLVNHLVIIGVQMTKDQMRLRGQSNINEIRARYNDIPTTLVSMSPLRKATLAPKRRDGQCGSKLEKDVGYEPNCSYIDEGVFSVCRLVEVWNFHNEDNGSDGEEGSVVDDEYSKESIEGDVPNRHFSKESIEGDVPNRHSDKEYQKKFSMEPLSLEDQNDSIYERFQEHVSKVERERKEYDNENKSLMSGSTLSTKGTLPRYNEGAIVLPIASILEEENMRRKSKSGKKHKSRSRRKSSGPRPIPDDIPEDLEINFGNFAQELVEWNTEQAYDDDWQAKPNDVIYERIDSYTDKGGYKSFDNPMKHAGGVANYDDQDFQDEFHRDERYGDNGEPEHDDQGSYQSGYNDADSAHMDDVNKDEEKGYSSDEFDDHRHKTEYYGDDQSSNDEYDGIDQTSTNSGIAALNDFNASRSNLDGHPRTKEEEDNDAFPDCWSEEEDLAPTTIQPTSSKLKPWHRKDKKDLSFMSSCESYD
jgi:hypothetical protein